jgi:hypothetical protein
MEEASVEANGGESGGRLVQSPAMGETQGEVSEDFLRRRSERVVFCCRGTRLEGEGGVSVVFGLQMCVAVGFSFSSQMIFRKKFSLCFLFIL